MTGAGPVPAVAASAAGVARARLARPAVLAGLAALLAGLMVLGLAVGALGIPPGRVIAVLAGRVGIDLGPVPREQEQVVWAIRMPRVVMGALVGATLGVAGAAMQGVFRNPLADPGLVGVSAGAALGAALAIVSGAAVLGAATVPAAAFAGGLAATLLCALVARRGSRTDAATLLLCGVALTSIAGAGVGLLSALADDDELRDIVFRTLGSVGGATWEGLAQAAPFMVAAIVLMPFWGARLNLLALGEREARHLGVDVDRMRLALIGLVALGVGAAVAVTGIVGFVGLVVPHVVRLVAGPDHRLLLPASALAGAALLVGCDLAARTLAAPLELPLGVVTGLVGGPVFLWLVVRTQRRVGRPG